MSERIDRDGIPEEALERLIGVLLWNQMNPEAEGTSFEDVARKALGAVLGYIDEYCPEWYGRQWLRPEEMAALTSALHGALAVEEPPPAMESVTWLDGMSARGKLLRALEP